MATHIVGIRHHGPGSARNVQMFLEEIKPDIVLVEGPPEADPILQWMGHEELQPPVAILVYQSDDIQHSALYPFAEFSPEWQAILYAHTYNIPVRFIDLPVAYCFALDNEIRAKASQEAGGQQENEDVTNSPTTEQADIPKHDGSIEIRRAPISYLAEAAGFDDEEKWWEQMFEHRVGNENVFEAVNEAMRELRGGLPQKEDRREQLREAWMRNAIRQAEKDTFQNIVVICGAWHAPALIDMPKQKDDNNLLKGLPKVKVECTWIPWTYSRLSLDSGYGAGITSPGWYAHIWNYPNDDGTRWIAGVATLFRKNRIDISVAHVIEAVRLAGALASMRNLPRAGLEELTDATLSVLCNGETVMLQLIRDELIVSNKLGTVPANIPKPPLQVDIEKQQKNLRLPATADWKDYVLDVRQDNDLKRSIFLHRLVLLGIPWGQKGYVSSKGTFKEQWRLQWDPSFVINIIEKGAWGNTLEKAANAWFVHQCNEETSLQHIAALLQQVIPAELPGAVQAVAQRINNMAAATNDVVQLATILPGIVDIMRYGNVRRTDAEMVRGIAESIITRVSIGLPAACCGIDEATATALADNCAHINGSIQLLQEENYVRQWQQCLYQIVQQASAAPLVRGFAARQLMNDKVLLGEPLYQLFYSSLSRSLPVAETAAWLEGFLKGSGTVLLLDDDLWTIVNDWVRHLEEDMFIQVLPLLRRTFSTFTPVERRKIGEKVKQGVGGTMRTDQTEYTFDYARAKEGLSVVLEILGYTLPGAAR